MMVDAVAHAFPRFMVINGDDFGISSNANHAIIDAHEQGILTSTSLMVTGGGVGEGYTPLWV